MESLSDLVQQRLVLRGSPTPDRTMSSTTSVPPSVLRGPDSPIYTGCWALQSDIEPWYGYEPSFAAGVAFSVIFFLSLCAHLAASFQSPRSYSIILAVSALTEGTGWAGRTWASKCPYNKSAFQMQIITLIIGPVFVTAAIYVMLGYLIRLRGVQYSTLKPKVYVYIFCTCDVIALIVQAAGAALASRAFDQGEDTSKGSHIVVGGVAFQLVTMLVFAILFLVFLLRSRSTLVSKRQHFMVLAMWISFVAVFVRSIFRCIQLGQGFHGYLSTHEGFFIGLDGAIMGLAIVVFNFIRLPKELTNPRIKTTVAAAY